MPGTIREKENGPDRAAGRRVLSLQPHVGEFHSFAVSSSCRGKHG